MSPLPTDGNARGVEVAGAKDNSGRRSLARRLDAVGPIVPGPIQLELRLGDRAQAGHRVAQATERYLERARS